MKDLYLLEELLKREVPAFNWRCDSDENSMRSPEWVSIRASQKGREVPDGRFQISVRYLDRWGVERVARLISIGISQRHYTGSREWPPLADGLAAGRQGFLPGIHATGHGESHQADELQP